MTRARGVRSGAMISLLGCLLLSTPVLAQTGGAGGSVNGGAAPAVGPVGFPVIPGTVANAAPTDRPGTYGGMGDSAPAATPAVTPTCAGPNCYNVNSYPQEMPTPPPEAPR